jgi:hypothetical protein
MWSGPRTVSTALMRAWENRPDTVVVDEPLYAFYLAETGLDHPGRDEVIASQPASWREVLRQLVAGPLPPGVTICHQKYMTCHAGSAQVRSTRNLSLQVSPRTTPVRHRFQAAGRTS